MSRFTENPRVFRSRLSKTLLYICACICVCTSMLIEWNTYLCVRVCTVYFSADWVNYTLYVLCIDWVKHISTYVFAYDICTCMLRTSNVYTYVRMYTQATHVLPGIVCAHLYPSIEYTRSCIPQLLATTVHVLASSTCTWPISLL
jgi:hypothetical protein